MKNLLLLLALALSSQYCKASIELPVMDTIPKKKVAVKQNEKQYCSDFAKTKYKLSITGTKIKITRSYKDFTDTYSGTIKNGKIYSNDPNEKNLKDVWGKYYKLEGKNFGVLNIENGDYEWFAECKH